MLRHLFPAVPVLLAAVLAIEGCRTEPGPAPAPQPAPEAARADDGNETIFRVIEKLEASRDLGDGKLERFLSDPDPKVRARATLAIGRIGQRRALLQLGPRFEDSSPAVRAAALLAAGLNRDDRFYPEALRNVGHDDALVRQRAVEALGRIGSPRAFDQVIAALKDPDTGVACAAADATFRLRDPRAIGPLGAALKDGPPRLRLHAANALERFQVSARDPISERPRELEPEIVAATKVAEPALIAAAADADPRVAAAALRALARRAGALADTEELKKALEQEQPEVVVAAASAIVPQRDEEAVQALTRLLAHADAHVRWSAIRGLAELHEVVKAAGEGGMLRKVEERVRHVLAADHEMQIRADAVVALALLRGAEGLEELQKDFMEHADYRLRAGLCHAAGRVGGTRALVILNRLLTDEDQRVRVAALSGLGELGGEGATQGLFRALEDRSASVRARSAEALRDLEDAAATGPLLKAFRQSEESPTVAAGEARYRILQALAHLGGRRYVGELNRALVDPSSMVRNGVVGFLEILNGYRPDVKYEAREDHNAPPLASGVNRKEQPRVILYTNKGEIHLELYPDLAPVHVRNFLSLVQNGFYHGKTIHRVVPGHVAQGGDPEGTGYGALEYTLPDEPSGETFKEGSLGMAQLGRDTGCCQFFITLAARPHLDGEYTLFGRVQQGMGVVRKLMPGDQVLKADWIRGE